MGGFHRQALLIERCGHARNDCPSEADDPMKSTFYVPFRFFSTLRSVIWELLTTFHILLRSFDRRVADPIKIKERRRCKQLRWQAAWIVSDNLDFPFSLFLTLGFQFEFPSPCLWHALHICQNLLHWRTADVPSWNYNMYVIFYALVPSPSLESPLIIFA